MSQTLLEPARAEAAQARTVPGSGQLRETILDAMGAGLFVCDARKSGFPIVQISPSFTTITAYPAEEAIGEKLSILYRSKLTQVPRARPIAL